MRERRTSGSMSGGERRSHGVDCDTGKGESRRQQYSPVPKATALTFDSTQFLHFGAASETDETTSPPGLGLGDVVVRREKARRTSG